MKIETKGSLPFLVQIVFLIGKFTGFLNWPWWLILSPIWVTFCLVILAMLVAFLIGFLSIALTKE
jgi:hypothetical protein